MSMDLVVIMATIMVMSMMLIIMNSFNAAQMRMIMWILNTIAIVMSTMLTKLTVTRIVVVMCMMMNVS